MQNLMTTVFRNAKTTSRPDLTEASTYRPEVNHKPLRHTAVCVSEGLGLTGYEGLLTMGAHAEDFMEICSTFPGVWARVAEEWKASLVDKAVELMRKCNYGELEDLLPGSEMEQFAEVVQALPKLAKKTIELLGEDDFSQDRLMRSFQGAASHCCNTPSRELLEFSQNDNYGLWEGIVHLQLDSHREHSGKLAVWLRKVWNMFGCVMFSHKFGAC